MGNKVAKPIPCRPSVPEGKTRICVAGFGLSHHTNRAGKVARAIAAHQPEQYETWFHFDTDGYRPAFLNLIKAELSEEQQKEFADHKSSPFCWLEQADGTRRGFGGRDKLCEWAMATFPEEKSVTVLASEDPSLTEVNVDETPGTAQATPNGKFKLVPARTPVPEGKTRICVSGFALSHHTNRAGKIARAIAAHQPSQYETWFHFDTSGFRPAFLDQIKSELSEEQQKEFADHKTSPFCWLESTDGKRLALGGRDKLCEWASATFPEEKSVTVLTAEGPSLLEVNVDETVGTAQVWVPGTSSVPTSTSTPSTQESEKA